MGFQLKGQLVIGPSITPLPEQELQVEFELGIAMGIHGFHSFMYLNNTGYSQFRAEKDCLSRLSSFSIQFFLLVSKQFYVAYLAGLSPQTSSKPNVDQILLLCFSLIPQVPAGGSLKQMCDFDMDLTSVLCVVQNASISRSNKTDFYYWSYRV